MNEYEKIKEWAVQVLVSRGFKPTFSFEKVQKTAWSSVSRILTDVGFFYLKQTPPLLSLEPQVICLLHHHFAPRIPEVIDYNSDLNCFLMREMGVNFYHFKKNPKRKKWISEAIKQYKIIQKKSIPLINSFLALGVPDWRVVNLPTLFNNLIAQENLLLEDGISRDELIKLSSLSSKCLKLCDQLSQFSISETLDHCDLHGGNILIEEKTDEIAIIDWGETVITHPFFSLIFFLRNLTEYYDFNENELWNDFFSDQDSDNFDKILFLAKKIEPVYSALAFHRLLLSSNKELFMQSLNCKGRITKFLKKFINS